jgi:hypothetical protein
LPVKSQFPEDFVEEEKVLQSRRLPYDAGEEETKVHQKSSRFEVQPAFGHQSNDILGETFNEAQVALDPSGLEVINE